MTDLIRIDVGGGKYTFVQRQSGGSYVLRYGEEWLTEMPAGANCWLAMAYELEELRNRHQSADELVEALEECMKRLKQSANRLSAYIDTHGMLHDRDDEPLALAAVAFNEAAAALAKHRSDGESA
jgi:hypothetical protein